MISIALSFETDAGTMPVHHLKMLGQHRTNYNMQYTVLAQLLYHLSTKHTYFACLSCCYDAGPPSLDAGPESNQRLAIGTRHWPNTETKLTHSA